MNSVPLDYYATMAQIVPLLVVGHVLVSARYAGRSADTGLPAALAAVALLGIVIGAVAEATALWVLRYGRKPVDVLDQLVVVAAAMNFVALVLGAAATYARSGRDS